MKYLPLSYLVLFLLLTACGGGGGGGGSEGVDRPVVSFSQAAEHTAASPPAFEESINQSANASDTVSTSFTPGVYFGMTVTRADGSPITLDTNNPSTVVANPEVSPVTGRTIQIGTLSGNSVRAGVLVDWGSNDPANYLAGGYWVYTSPAGSVEIGAFMDGREFSRASNPPVSGNAEYTGIAGGTYVIGSTTGEYLGDLSLTANFNPGNMGISGNITGIRLHNQGRSIGNILALGPSGFELDLGTANIASDGTFTGSDTVLDYNGNQPWTVVSTGGYWGGRFSTERDSEGNPRMVAGTHGGSLTVNNDPVSFVGTFYGATEQYKRDLTDDMQMPDGGN